MEVQEKVDQTGHRAALILLTREQVPSLRSSECVQWEGLPRRPGPRVSGRLSLRTCPVQWKPPQTAPGWDRAAVSRTAVTVTRALTLFCSRHFLSVVTGSAEDVAPTLPHCSRVRLGVSVSGFLWPLLRASFPCQLLCWLLGVFVVALVSWLVQ